MEGGRVTSANNFHRGRVANRDIAAALSICLKVKPAPLAGLELGLHMASERLFRKVDSGAQQEDRRADPRLFWTDKKSIRRHPRSRIPLPQPYPPRSVSHPDQRH